MDPIRVLLAAAAAGAIAGLLNWAHQQPGPPRRTTTWICPRCLTGYGNQPAAAEHLLNAHPDNPEEAPWEPA